MNRKKLHELFLFLCNHRIDARSETHIDALSRMCIAVNDLLCVMAIDDYDNRRLITRQIDLLYNIPDRKSIKGLTRRYRLTKEVSMAVYGEKDEECSNLYHYFINNYIKKPDPKEETDAMRCIVYELGDILEDNTQFDFHPYFRQKCLQWIDELDGEGHWKGISVETALQRLELLQDNCCVFRDSSFDDVLFRAYDYYKRHLTLPQQAKTADLPQLGAWYDLLRRPGVFPYERELLRRIAGLMEDHAAAAAPRSDAWYFAISYAVIQCCTDIMSKAQRNRIQKAG